MNKHDVQLLQQFRGYPAISILLPTHRTSPDNRQDPIRVRNLVLEAGNRLLQEFSKREMETILARLEQAANEIDYRGTLDGLAIFVNQDISRILYLPFTLNERVVIDETFATRDLVYALNRTTRYWVLALSENSTRLFEGVREELIEIREEGFPLVHTGATRGKAVPTDPAVQASAYRDERHRQFFRQVDEAFKPFYTDDELPLVVVGVDRYLAFFQEVTARPGAVAATLQGNYDKAAPHELGKLVWPLMEEVETQRRLEYLDVLGRAVGQRKFVSTAEQVWRLAQEGRGRLLLVEQDFHFPGRLSEDGRLLFAADDPTAPDVMTDAVNEIIEMVLSKQGQVVFVDNGQLEQHQRIALVLRY
ncbi:MAG: hypothetical protein IPM39_21605 [Chloroflexi bacterium]|nr:hypothetical protein [Chloroflexota bacterium]